MAKDRGRNDERSRIAHLAARLMAEDGVEDYATAKRKAARQAGVPDTRQLPTNDEIDLALRTHQALYGGDEQRERLRALRGKALEVMRELAAFNPYLTGSVLSGNAGKYADIDLHLYAESPKSVEMYFIDRRISYRAGQTRLCVGEQWHIVPTYGVEHGGMHIEIVVLGLDDLRQPVRTTSDGKPIERARAPAVENLLAET